MTQSIPYAAGETLYRAFFPRNGEGIVIAEGRVTEANDVRFLVRSNGRLECQLQSAPAGWHRTRSEAVAFLGRGIEITRERVETDAQRLVAKGQHVRQLLADLVATEAR